MYSNFNDGSPPGMSFLNYPGIQNSGQKSQANRWSGNLFFSPPNSGAIRKLNKKSLSNGPDRDMVQQYMTMGEFLFHQEHLFRGGKFSRIHFTDVHTAR